MTLEELSKRLELLEKAHEFLSETVTNVGAALEALRASAVVRSGPSQRNRSSAMKREMTDEDAVECLIGSTKDLGHKDAADQMGLTYAQVYSCRLEYTFKHVHKKLRETGFKSHWAR